MLLAGHRSTGGSRVYRGMAPGFIEGLNVTVPEEFPNNPLEITLKA